MAWLRSRNRPRLVARALAALLLLLESLLDAIDPAVQLVEGAGQRGEGIEHEPTVMTATDKVSPRWAAPTRSGVAPPDSLSRSCR